MRIWILIFSAALFVGGTCLGVALQPRINPAAAADRKIETAPPPPSFPHHFSVQRFTEHLQLTDEQNRELDAILSDSQEETQALGRAMKAAQDKSREKIVAILTPEQKSTLDELMAAERKKRSEAELDRTVATYTKILKLDESQAKGFRAAIVEGRKGRREIKPGGDWRQARKDVREQQNKSIEAALTQEQYQRYLEVSELERYER